MPTENLGGAQRSSEIRFQNGVPVFLRKVERWRALGPACAVDENVYLAKRFDRLCENLFEAGAIQHVRSAAHRPPPERPDFVGRLLHEIAAARGGHDVGASFRQPQCEGVSNSACTTDDNSRLSRKIKCLVRHLSAVLSL